MLTPEQLSTIYSFIQSEAGIDASAIDPHSDLRAQAVLDSMQFVSLIARIENELGIEIPISAMEVNSLAEFMGLIETAVKNG